MYFISCLPLFILLTSPQAPFSAGEFKQRSTGIISSMPAYHSAFNDLKVQEVCGCAILPIKTRSRGPAPPAPEGQDDVVDEIIQLFRANVLFTNYEVKGNADRVLIYGTLFVHLCLKKLDKCATKADGKAWQTRGEGCANAYTIKQRTD